MQYPDTISFTNPGEIDIRAVTTLGISAKDDPNAIGYFGTGLKYAIAILLRTGHDITIYAGEDAYIFTSRTETLRDKDYSVVCMNGEPLGFTTHLGANWELWQAYRELYCNTQDEGGTVQEGALEPQAGHTTIVVKGTPFAQEHHERHKILLSESPRAATPHADILSTAGVIFYQGVKVAQVPGHFGYNIKEKLRLTEDRTVASHFDLTWIAQKAWARVDDRELCDLFLRCEPDSFEAGLDFTHHAPTETMLDATEAIIHDKKRQVHSSLRKRLEDRKPDATAIAAFTPSATEQATFERARAFVESTFSIDTGKYNVVFAQDLGSGIMGLAKAGTIYISREAFEHGTKEVAKTLLEEWIHLHHDVKDCTRQMQNILFNRIVHLAEEHMWKEPL